MRHRFSQAALFASVVFGLLLAGSRLQTAEPIHPLAGLEEMAHVMINVTERERPTHEEWSALHEDGQRLAMLGGVADFKSKSISFMNTRYLTANSHEGTLASYGKMSHDKRYDRFGHIEGVEFSVEQNSWKERYVLNAAALFKLTGSRFLEYAGLAANGSFDKKQQIDVTFLGTAVPKDEAIRRLNGNIEALEYLAAVQQKRAAYDRERFKFGTTAPPAPKVVLANVVMLNGEISDALDVSAEAKLHSKVVGDGIELSFTKKDGEQVTLLSPVVRCYRTYSIEFKTDANGRLVLRTLADKDGNTHQVPQVFDLTPDI